MHIGIPGTGKMGSAIALRLLELGHQVSVWNRTAARAEGAVKAGAVLVGSPRALADRCDVILSILTDAAAITAAYDGPQGILAGTIAGKLVVDMSTVQAATAVALAGKVRKAGAAFVECPVGGTTGPARQGKLLGLAGGEPGDIARARPLLEQLCRRVEHIGPVGTGARMKLAINLPLLVAYQALGEAYILARGSGRDASWIMDLFSDTSGAPNVLKTRGPNIAAAIDGQALPPAFDVDSIRKDLRTMIVEAAGEGAELPLATRALAVFDQAAKDGWGGKDGATLPSYWAGQTKRAR